MGASNWAECPRCARGRAATLDEMRAALKRSYGSVPVEEFDAMREDIFNRENTTVVASLREDYGFYGAEDGIVIAEYRCSCKVCGLQAYFTHQHELDV